MCLYGFASVQNSGHTRLRHPCLACSSRCTEYCHPHNHCKRTIIPRPAPTPLPPLSKVRCCRPKEFGRLPEGLLHHSFQSRTIPCFAPTPLPPLSKGGGLTARHKLSLCCIFTCDTSAFLIYQTFRRQDGGIATPLLLKPHYPLLCTTFLPYERSVGFASLPRQPLVSLRPAATKCG